MSSSTILYENSLLEKYVRNRSDTTFGIQISSGVPSIIGPEKPKLLLERGLAGSQVALTQTNIDELLGSTDEVDAAEVFGATAMVADNTFGMVVDFNGQLKSVDFVELAQNTPSLAIELPTATLANAGFTGLEYQVTSLGNFVLRFQQLNVTAAATNLLIVLSAYSRMK